jgi:hypothetical protein
MSATIIPFSRNASEALQAYQRLVDEAAADRRLMVDRDHLERRIVAKDRYFTLAKREAR